MAEKNVAGANASQKETQEPTKFKPTQAIVARRLKAVTEAGNLTPKMQRGFDRLAASIASKQ